MSIPLQRFKQERALSSAGSEHLPYKQRVGGSNPSAPTTSITFLLKLDRRKSLGRLAQLVQSICLTSRGSGVRIPQRPPEYKRRIHSTESAFLFLLTIIPVITAMITQEQLKETFERKLALRRYL